MCYLLEIHNEIRVCFSPTHPKYLLYKAMNILISVIAVITI